MNILTFDIEDWFHLLDIQSTKTEKEWNNYDSRIEHNVERILEILSNTNCSASFFVLGWIAEKYPRVVRDISDCGYEIGSHTTYHQLVYSQTRDEFFQDVKRSIGVLEDISGKKVTMFRAPGFSITEKNLWAFDVLYELGIEIDSSVFPARRSHGGMQTYGIAEPSILKFNGVQLREFPINTVLLRNTPFVFSGGGYFRLLPYEIIKHLTNRSDYVMSYFHPRDFDINQPILKGLTVERWFKSYVGLKRAEGKFRKWVSEFDFVDIRKANEIIEWDEVRMLDLEKLNLSSKEF